MMQVSQEVSDPKRPDNTNYTKLKYGVTFYGVISP